MRGVSTSKGGHQQPQSNVKCNFPNGKGPIVMSVLDIGRKDVSKKEKGHSYSLLSLPATQTHTSNITGGNTTKQDTGLPGLREISSSVNVTADNSANGPLPCTKDNVAPSSNDNQCNDGQLIHIYLSTTPSNSNEVSGMSCTEEIPTGNANGAYRAEAHLKTEKDDLCEYTAHITQDSTAAEKIMQQSENTRDSTHITRETADKTDQEEDFKTIMLATKLGGKEFLEKTEDDLVSPGSTKESKKSHSVTYQVMARENSGSDTSVKMSGNLKETNKVQQSGKLSPLKRGPAKNANTPSRSFSPVKSPHNSSVKKVETKSLNQFNAKDIKKAPSKTNPPTAVSPKGIQKSSGSLSAIPSPISLNKSSAGEKTISKLSLECSPPPKVVSTPKKRQVYVAEKPAEKLQEPDVVRRSSSGRIIKRKQFDDEITDVNSAKKSKGNSLMMR
ncbi:unnamed protein product [Lymnaea stagnalis]|uniref:Uncharacterized protein n=1 Tax=Lymnaea stagnalis TaxID=6523 RepID=A0AAV2GXY4_LYMST